MTPLGKPLVFYLKYMAEMERLYADLEEGKERDLTGLDDAEHVLEMARTVGDTACDQVADFLATCGKGVEDHFTGLGIATLAKKSTRSFVKKYWYWRAEIHISSVYTFLCGVWVNALPDVLLSLPKDVCGVVVPWLIPKGGRKGADVVWEVLGSWAAFRTDRGDRIELARIPIQPQPPESFDVDRDPLIAEVMKTFARIGAEEIKAIASFVAGLKESRKAELGNEIEKEEP